MGELTRRQSDRDNNVEGTRQNSRFRELLVASLLQEQPASRIFEGPRRASRLKNAKLRRFAYGFNQRVLTWLWNFQRMDGMKAPLGDKQRTGKLTFIQKFTRLLEGETRRRGQWPYLALVLYLFCLMFLTVNLCYQYKYDVNKAKLTKFNSLMNDTKTRLWLLESMEMKPSEFQHQLELNVKQARAALKRIGSSHLEWSFTVESIIFYFFVPSIFGMIVKPLYYQLSEVSVVTPRFFMSRLSECQLRADLIICELNKFISSSLLASRVTSEARDRNMYMVKVSSGFSRSPNQQPQTQPQRPQRRSSNLMPASPEVSKTNNELDFTLQAWRSHFSTRHAILSCQVRTLALSGQLNPLNRNSIWCDKFALIVCFSIILLWIHLIVMPIVIHSYLQDYFNSKSGRVEFESVRDVHAFAWHVFIYIVCLFNSTVTMVMHLATLVDMNEAARCLEVLLKQVVVSNELRYHKLTSLLLSSARPNATPSQASRIKQLARAIELDLMTALLQFRLLRSEFRLSRRPLGLTAGFFIYFAIATTAIVRLHNPYFGSEMREANLTMGMTNILPCFCMLLPLAQLTKRCLDAFRVLWSLVAQSVRHERSMPAGQLNRYLNVEVTLYSLRRELTEAHLTATNFACRIFDVDLTFANLIKLMFWLFFIAISLLDNSNSLADSSLGHWINDPFDLFAFAPA